MLRNNGSLPTSAKWACRVYCRIFLVSSGEIRLFLFNDGNFAIVPRAVTRRSASPRRATKTPVTSCSLGQSALSLVEGHNRNYPVTRWNNSCSTIITTTPVANNFLHASCRSGCRGWVRVPIFEYLLPREYPAGRLVARSYDVIASSFENDFRRRKKKVTRAKSPSRQMLIPLRPGRVIYWEKNMQIAL